MPKLNAPGGWHLGNTLRYARDSRDEIGAWSWDAASDRAFADTYVAHLFNVDPVDAGVGLPVAAYVASIHPADRRQVLAAFRKDAREGRPYLFEYRVRSADGVTRWVLTRGRFFCNHRGQPVSGRGIIVDITRLRANRDGDGLSDTGSDRSTSSLDQAAAAAIAAYQTLGALNDRELTSRAEALLNQIGRRLAAQELTERRRRLS